jgi:hypothetical protein
MSPITTWAVGLLAVFGVILGQLIFPFAFDFVSTLAVYGIGVFVGRQTRTTA